MKILFLIILFFSSNTFASARVEEQVYFGINFGYNSSDYQYGLPFGAQIELNNPWVGGLLLGLDVQVYPSRINPQETFNMVYSSLKLKYFVNKIVDDGLYVYGSTGWISGNFSIIDSNGNIVKKDNLGSSNSFGVGYSLPISKETSFYGQVGLLINSFNSVVEKYLKNPTVLVSNVGVSF